MKKFLVFIAILGAMFSTTAFLTPENTFADTGINGRACPDFLGLTSWDCGLNGTPSNETELKSGIWMIASNIATDIAIIAAYLVLGYVIYGGYLYIFSAGDPGKAAEGKKTLTQAFIGLAIVMSANLIMGTIRAVLVGGRFKDCTDSNCIKPNDLIENMINWFISMAGIVSVVFLIYGGIQYMTSAGDATKLEKAKKVIMYALIGLAIVALSVAITAFVSSTIRSSGTSNLIEQIKLAKGI
ncbi:hypothetical protein IKF03_03575 [Candidatus Saccharibacteria bacterium]|nr:hypothetical protein [Candidatus Saccharibacteria bacterium]